MKFFPTKKQWNKWSIPSKLTAISAYLGILMALLYFIEKAITIKQWSNKVDDPIETKDEKEINPIFKASDSTFNILILPFFDPNYENGSKCVGESIFFGLENLKDKDSLDIEIFFANNLDIPQNSEEAKKLQDFHNSDFTIYGLSVQNDQYCNDIDICFKYALDSKIIETIDNTLSDQSTNSDLINSSSKTILEGYLSAEINTIIYWVIAMTNIKHKNYSKSIPYLEKIIYDYESHNEDIIKTLLNTYLRENKISKAESLLTNSKFNKKGFDFIYYSARILKKRNKYADAIVKFDYLIKNNPSKRINYSFGRVNIAEELKQYDKAFEDYSFLINKGIKSLLKHRAKLYAEVGDYKNAKKDLDRDFLFAKTREDTVVNYIARSMVFHKFDKDTESIDNYEKLLNLNFSTHILLMNLSDLYLKNGDINSAFFAIQKAKKLKPNNKNISLRYETINKIIDSD